MRATRLAGLAVLVCALVYVAGAGSATSPLPGGTSLDVTITSPTTATTVAQGAPVTVTGTAAVGTGAPVANTSLIYIVDVSGSTSAPTGVSGKCPHQNIYDTSSDTTLDCELLAIRDLNQAAIATGTIKQIGMIGFAGTGTDTSTNITSAAALDLNPAAGVSTLVAPDANTFTPFAGMATAFPPLTNLDWVIQSAYLASGGAVPPIGPWPPKGVNDGFTLFGAHDVGLQTNYTAALFALYNLLQTSIPTGPVVVAFLSDGFSSQTVAGIPLQNILNQLPPGRLTIDTFAVGSSTCGSAAQTLDGSLEQIAVHYGKHCQVLTNASDAVDIVPGVVASKLTSVTVSVDGGAQAPATITPALPVGGANGPATVSWTRSLGALAPGLHHICATSNGTDGGGSGSTQDCVDVTVKAPPTVTVDNPTATTSEGTAFPISASASDGTTTWAISTGPCFFADPSSPSTTVTCLDNGTFTLLFIANDGVNPVVIGTETLTVTNVAPTPALTLSPGPHAVGSSVTANVAISDPGTLDTQTCMIDWGDGTTSPPIAAAAGPGSSCSASHAYASAGPFTVTVSVTDKDGGTGHDSTSLVVNSPPAVNVFDKSGNEGSPIPLTATASDPDGDALTFGWTATPASGVAPGATCTFSDATSLAPSITCNDNGTWTLTFTAADGVNPAVSASAALTVANVNPTAALTLSPGPHAVGSSVTASATIVDPGSIDTQTCTFEWGDGTSPSTVAASGLSCSATHAYAASGPYTVTVTVVDKDGGSGSDSQNVSIDGPPTVHVSNASGNEGSAIPLTATAFDPEGDPLSFGWTATPGAGVAAGATCTFSSTTVLAPSITCNDNGTWTITLTVGDGINAAVVTSATLTVANVNPTSTLTLSAPPHAVGSTVTASVSIVDPGVIDTQTCVIDWGDGSPAATVAAAGSSCSAPHTYAAAGSFTVKVTVTDKDGGTGTDSKPVVINGPPTVSVSNASGNEGAAIPVTATATDAENDHLTYAWTATAGAGVDAGAACTFANPAALGTTVKCTDDGTWTLTLVVSDGVNPPVTKTATLTVANVAPTVTITSPATGSTSKSVSFSATVTDSGANDVLSCSINWGDGSAAQTVPVAGGACTTSHTYAASVASATITVTASDDDGGTATATRALSFNRPPVCSAVHANPDTLWPPNGDMRLVQLVGGYDPDGGPVTYTITGVTQDEPLGLPEGHDYSWFHKWNKKPDPDAVILHGPYLLLRAYRDPHGDGRTYTISFTVTDSQGATCSGTTTVEVPHDLGHHSRHGEQHYNSCGWKK